MIITGKDLDTDIHSYCFEIQCDRWFKRWLLEEDFTKEAKQTNLFLGEKLMLWKSIKCFQAPALILFYLI